MAVTISDDNDSGHRVGCKTRKIHIETLRGGKDKAMH